jgi:excisionase family DNA binding protein
MLDKNEQRYMGSKEAAELWGVSQSTISKWCRERLIDRAEQDKKGSPWRIPRDAVKPTAKSRKRT